MGISIIKQYNDEEFIEIVKNSFSYADCMRSMGYTTHSGDSLKKLKNRIQELDIDISHFQSINTERTEENVFCKDSTANQSTLRRWYEKGQYTEYKCSICGQEPFWNNKPMSLILDHINGENHDDRLENLRWVCPNCNIQLDTTGSRNKTEHKVNYCPDCGKLIGNKSTYCVECSRKHRNIEFIESLPVNKEELFSLLQEYNGNFTAVGKLFNKSDNAIRKWCVNFGIPSHSSDYKPVKTTEEKKEVNNQPKKVAKIDKNTNEIIEVYNSIIEANNANPSANKHISAVCKGTRKTAGGFKWQYI